MLMYPCLESRNYNGSTFTCIDDECMNETIYCDDYVDCIVACNGNNACFGAQIECPINAVCTIDCNGIQSCKQIMIDAVYSLSLSMICSKYRIHAKTFTIN